MKPFDRRTLSIDMGNHSYKIIEAVKKPDVHILRYEILPPEESGAAGALAGEGRKLRYRTMDAVMSFHHESTVIRELKLSEKDDSRLPLVIEEEMLQYQTDFRKEYDFDYLLLPERDATGQRIAQTAAVSRSVNREYIEKAISLGLKPKAVDVQIHAALRVLHRLTDRCGELSPLSSYLILDLGCHSTTIAIVYLGKVFGSRVIPVGCGGSEGAPEDSAGCLSPILRNCVDLIDTFTYAYAGIPLQQGLVYGGGVYTGILSDLKRNIPLDLTDMGSFRSYFPEIPPGMDLNLYVNCFGSLLRKEDTG